MYLHMNIICVIVLIATTFLAAPAGAITLKGGIDHADRLAPADPSLHPGEVFDPMNLPGSVSATDSNRWYQIPNWLSGTWHKETQTNTYLFSYTTGRTDNTTKVEVARSDGTWGTQQDNQGRIWQYDPTPFTSIVDSDEYYVVQYVTLSEPVMMSDKSFVRRSIDTQLRVSKSTHRIMSVEAGEQIITYTPESADLVRRESSSKVFDKSGQPILLGKSFAFESKAREFVPQNTYKGKDLRSLFHDFIVAQQDTSMKVGQ